MLQGSAQSLPDVALAASCPSPPGLPHANHARHAGPIAGTLPHTTPPCAGLSSGIRGLRTFSAIICLSPTVCKLIKGTNGVLLIPKSQC